MSIFQKRELSTCGGTELTPPRAAVCFTTSAMTRRAADWLARLGGCRPLGVLSDHGEDVIWQCEAENVDLLLLSGIFSQMYASWIVIGSRTGELESLLQLYKDGRLDKHTAISEAVNPEIMSKRLNLL